MEKKVLGNIKEAEREGHTKEFPLTTGMMKTKEPAMATLMNPPPRRRRRQWASVYGNRIVGMKR